MVLSAQNVCSATVVWFDQTPSPFPSPYSEGDHLPWSGEGYGKGPDLDCYILISFRSNGWGLSICFLMFSVQRISSIWNYQSGYGFMAVVCTTVPATNIWTLSVVLESLSSQLTTALGCWNTLTFPDKTLKEIMGCLIKGLHWNGFKKISRVLAGFPAW